MHLGSLGGDLLGGDMLLEDARETTSTSLLALLASMRLSRCFSRSSKPTTLPTALLSLRSQPCFSLQQVYNESGRPPACHPPLARQA